jgi:hypothetical protein
MEAQRIENLLPSRGRTKLQERSDIGAVGQRAGGHRIECGKEGGGSRIKVHSKEI